MALAKGKLELPLNIFTIVKKLGSGNKNHRSGWCLVPLTAVNLTTARKGASAKGKEIKGIEFRRAFGQDASKIK
jgi:hypothetical protein